MPIFKDRLQKDYGNDTSLWYCMDKLCKSVYNKDELTALDADGKVIWGKLGVGFTTITPICPIHGIFLMFLAEQSKPNMELLL